MDLLCFGEALYDIFDGKETIGGAPLNVAITTHLLGLKTSIITALGNDTRGDRILLYLRKHKLHEHTQINSHPTGTVKVIVEADQHRFEIQDNTAYDYIAPFTRPTAKMFYLGTLAQRHRASRQTCHALLAKQDCVFFDPNLRPNTPWQKSFEQTMPHTTILKISDQEESIIKSTLDTNNLPATLFSNYPLQQLLITRGKNGASLYLRDGSHLTTDGLVVQTLNTVGAGDGFSAGYIYSYLKNKSSQDCLDFANKIGAALTTIKSAQPTTITINGGNVLIH